jgi:hypothetical protein
MPNASLTIDGTEVIKKENGVTSISNSVNIPSSIGGSEIFLESKTASNSTEIRFELQGNYEIYRVRILRSKPVNDGGNFVARVATSSSETLTASGYLGQMFKSYYDGSTSGTVTAQSTYGMWLADQVGAASTDFGYSGDVLIYNPHSTVDYTQLSSVGVGMNVNTYLNNQLGSGTYQTYRNDTHIGFIFDNGNISIGKFILYAIKTD